MHRTVKDDPERRGDDQILLRVARGDENAFGQLYDRFAPGLFTVALRIVFEPREAEDVLQEAFHHIWKRADTFDSNRSSAFTWAVMIVRNKAIDRLRVRHRLHRTAEKAADLHFFPEVDDASAAAPLVRERRREIRSAIDRIPPEQQQAVGLAFFGGLTHEEIADRLSEPLGTIKARIRRGLLRLRELLKEAV